MVKVTSASVNSSVAAAARRRFKGRVPINITGWILTTLMVILVVVWSTAFYYRKTLKMGTYDQPRPSSLIRKHKDHMSNLKGKQDIHKVEVKKKVEAKKVLPKKVEPKKVEPKKVEAKKAPPKKVEPKKASVKKIEHKKVESKKEEPKKVEPKKVEPKKVEKVDVTPGKLDTVKKWSSKKVEREVDHKEKDTHAKVKDTHGKKAPIGAKAENTRVHKTMDERRTEHQQHKNAHHDHVKKVK